MNARFALLLCALLTVPALAAPLTGPGSPGPLAAAVAATAAAPAPVAWPEFVLPEAGAPALLPPGDIVAPAAAPLGEGVAAPTSPPGPIAWEPVPDLPAPPTRTAVQALPVPELRGAVAPPLPEGPVPTPGAAATLPALGAGLDTHDDLDLTCLLLVDIPDEFPFPDPFAGPPPAGAREARGRDLALDDHEALPVLLYSLRVLTTHGNYVQYPWLVPTGTGLPGVPVLGVPVDLDDDLVPDGCAALVLGSTFGFQRALWWTLDEEPADAPGASIEWVVRADLLHPFADWTAFGMAFDAQPPEQAGLLLSHRDGEARRTALTASLSVGQADPVTLLTSAAEQYDTRTFAATARFAPALGTVRLVTERIPERTGAILDVDVSDPTAEVRVAYRDDAVAPAIDEHAVVTLDASGVASNLHVAMDALADGADVHLTATSARPTQAFDLVWAHQRDGATHGQTLRVDGPVTTLQLGATRPDRAVLTHAGALAGIAFASWDHLAEAAAGIHLTMDQPDAAGGYLGFRLEDVRRLEASRTGVGPSVIFEGLGPQELRLESRRGADALLANLAGAPGSYGWVGDGLRGFTYDAANATTTSLDVHSVVGLSQATARIRDFDGHARFAYDLGAMPLRAESGGRFGALTLELMQTGGHSGTEWRRVRLDAVDTPSLDASWTADASTGRVALYDPGERGGRVGLLATTITLAPAPPGPDYLVAQADGDGDLALRLDLQLLNRAEWAFRRGGMEAEVVGGFWKNVQVQDHLTAQPNEAMLLGLPDGAYLDWTYRQGFAVRAPTDIAGFNLDTLAEAVRVRGPAVAVDGITHAAGVVSVTGDARLDFASVDRTLGGRAVHLDLDDGQGGIVRWDRVNLLGFTMEVPGSGYAQRVRFHTAEGPYPTLAPTHRGIVVRNNTGTFPGSIDFHLEDTRDFEVRWGETPATEQRAVPPLPCDPRTSQCTLPCDPYTGARCDPQCSPDQRTCDPQCGPTGAGCIRAQDAGAEAIVVPGRARPLGMHARGTAESGHALDVIRIEAGATLRSTLSEENRGLTSRLFNLTLESNYVDRALDATNRTDRFVHEHVLTTSAGAVPFHAYASGAGHSGAWLLDVRLGAGHVSADRGAATAFLRLADPLGIANTAFRLGRIEATGFPEAFTVGFDPGTGAFVGTVLNGTASSVRFDVTTGGYLDLGLANDWLVLGRDEVDKVPVITVSLRGLNLDSATGYAGDGVDFFNWTASAGRVVQLRSAVRFDGLRATVTPDGDLTLGLAAGPRLIEAAAGQTITRIDARWCSSSFDPDACPGLQVRAQLIRAMAGLTQVPFAPDKVEVTAPASPEPKAGEEPALTLDYTQPGLVPVFETRYSDMRLVVQGLHHQPGIEIADVHNGKLTTEDGKHVVVDLEAWTPAAQLNPLQFFAKGRPGPDHIAYAAERDVNPNLWYQYVSFLGTFAAARLDGHSVPRVIGADHEGGNPLALLVHDERLRDVQALADKARGELEYGYSLTPGAHHVRVRAEGVFSPVNTFARLANFGFGEASFDADVTFANDGGTVAMQLFHLDDEIPSEGGDPEWTHHGANPDSVLNMTADEHVKVVLDADLVDANQVMRYVGTAELAPNKDAADDKLGAHASWLECFRCMRIDDPPLCITCDSDLEWLHYGQAVASARLTASIEAYAGGVNRADYVACGWAAGTGSVRRAELGGVWSYDDLEWTNADDDTLAGPEIYHADISGTEAYVDGSRTNAGNELVPLDHKTHCVPAFTL